MATKSSKSRMIDGPRIAVVGAGIAGISFAIALKRQTGHKSYVIYERGSDLGGTWRDNMYPGCASDVPINFYSLSTDLKPDWDCTHGFQPQIQHYWKDLSHKHDVHSHIIFNRNVISAEWDVAEHCYHIVTEDVVTRIQEKTTAEILISALGNLDVINYPDIVGLSTFRGTKFHSARWAHEVDLSGKRVGVVGNGASASQLIPRISEDPKVTVTQFCRTPEWFLPAPQPIHRSIGRINQWGELVYWGIFGTQAFRPWLTKAAKRYIERATPEKYHGNIIPDYPIGCKRLLLDIGYTTALHRSNMSLNWDGIDHITEGGIVTLKGEEIALDVLIFATGYITDSFPLHIRGRTHTVKDYYDMHDGPKAYLGTTVPGVPNLFILAGPNASPASTSLIFFEECQINYSLQLIQPILKGIVSSVEVTSEATDAYNIKIHARLDRSIFVSCMSWYRRGEGGKVFSLFPGSPVLFWWWLRSVNWEHYVVLPHQPWQRYRERQSIVRRLLILLSIATFVWLVVSQIGTFGLV